MCDWRDVQIGHTPGLPIGVFSILKAEPGLFILDFDKIDTKQYDL